MSERIQTLEETDSYELCVLRKIMLERSRWNLSEQKQRNGVPRTNSGARHTTITHICSVFLSLFGCWILSELPIKGTLKADRCWKKTVKLAAQQLRVNVINMNCFLERWSGWCVCLSSLSICANHEHLNMLTFSTLACLHDNKWKTHCQIMLGGDKECLNVSQPWMPKSLDAV